MVRVLVCRRTAGRAAGAAAGMPVAGERDGSEAALPLLSSILASAHPGPPAGLCPGLGAQEAT